MKKIAFPIVTLAILTVTTVFIIMFKQVPVEAKKYIDQKESQQSADFYHQLDSVFDHHQIEIYPIYSGYKSRFVKWDAENQTGSNFKDVIRGAYRQPDLPNISSTYYVAPENENPYTFSQGLVDNVKEAISSHSLYDTDFMSGLHGGNKRGIWQTGWALGVREYDAMGIREYIIIPYAVSYRKSKFGSLEDYYSIDDILDYAFKFYTEDEASPYKSKIILNTRNFVLRPDIINDFYYLGEPKPVDNPPTMFINSYASYERGKYVYSDIYYVFIKAYDYKIYQRVLMKKNMDSEEKNFISRKRGLILFICLPILGILVLTWISLLISIIKESYENRKTTLQRIITHCNPHRYVKNYNEERLKSANDIYSKALATDEGDDISISELATRAETELGAVLVSKRDTRALQKLCNPKRFMKPYDAQKVDRANELFGKLDQRVISYSVFAKIKEEINLLYGKNEPVYTSHVTNENLQKKDSEENSTIHVS